MLSKIQSNDLRVVDQIALEQPKTKVVARMFKALSEAASAQVVASEEARKTVHIGLVAAVANAPCWRACRARAQDR